MKTLADKVAIIPMPKPPPIPEPSWQAILNRDRHADGQFVYAVKTTGIFCRPSCPSRKPRRHNIELFASAAAAEHSGYRPCKRCRPRDGSANDGRAAAIAELCRFIDGEDSPPSVAELADRAGWTPSHLSRVFRKVTGLTPKEYIRGRRRQRVRTELADQKSVTRALFDAGYNSSGRFYEDADQALGMSPTAYRRRGAGEIIRFAVGSTSLGEILVAATDKGVCAVSLGDDPDALVRELDDRFRNADIVAGAGEFDQWVAQVVGLVEDPTRTVDLPLDVRGTAFQLRVWAALRAVPCGSVVSYGQLAKTIGSPTASRAVARACASNPIALAIPCHRVVRKDGSISGYRWGVARKRAILAREQAGQVR